MRPLHRPMFRYGGPIKEGVMSGIREPHAGGGRAALVGNPVYPRTGGREHHLKSLKDIPKFIKPGYWGGFVKPGTVGGKIKDWFKPKTMPDTVRYGLGRTRVPTKWEGVKNWYKTTPVGKYVAGSPEGKLTSYALGVGKGIIPKVVKGAATSPLGILSGAYMLDAFPGGQPLLNLDMLGNRNILGQRYDPKTDKRIKGTGISSLWEDEAEVLTTDTGTKKLTEEEKAALAVEKKAQAEAAKVAREKFAADQMAKRIENYRSIMNVEGMSKDAAYDSLIAASKLTSESGDFKGDIKSGNLINKIIQSTSKAFDKPKATKDAINTLILKGEIEKDIAGAKPGTQYKAASDYASLNGVSVSQAYKDLGFTKKGNIAENLTAVNKSLGTTGTTSESLSQAIKISMDGAIPKILADDSKLAEIKKDEKFKDTVTLFAETVKEKELGPGIYIIGAEAFQLNEDGSATQLY